MLHVEDKPTPVHKKYSTPAVNHMLGKELWVKTDTGPRVYSPKKKKTNQICLTLLKILQWLFRALA